MQPTIEGYQRGLQVEDLSDTAAYDLLETLRFDDINAFVMEYYWKRRGRVTYAHYGITAAFLGLMVGVFLNSDAGVSHWLTAWGLGMVGFLFLLPIHEGIHGLAYKFFGAKDIRYGLNLRQGIAYATAHRFVIDGRRFAWVALAPFLVITAILLSATAAMPDYRLFLLSVLLWHTLGTAGDFSLLNYFWLHRDRDVVTWDDAETKVSYFYAARG